MANMLSADVSIHALVQSPTEALQPQLTQDEPLILALSPHEAAVSVAKPLDLKASCKVVFEHRNLKRSAPSSPSESVSAHVDTTFDSDLRKLKRGKQNTQDKFNASKKKQTADIVKEESVTGLALQLTTSNSVTALYQGVSELILNEICKSLGGGNEAAISIDKKKATSQIAEMIQAFISTNFVQLVDQERQKFGFIRTTPKGANASARYGKKHYSNNSATESTWSWSSLKCYSEILPIDIVDRVEQNWQDQKKTSMRCVADNRADSKGTRQRCKNTCNLNKALFHALVQDLSGLPRPCEFSQVAKILTEIVGMAFCKKGGISHQKKARSGIYGLCRHFYQNTMSLNRAEELKQLGQWLKGIVKKDEPDKESALPQVPPHPAGTEVELQETTYLIAGASGDELFLFKQRSWYEDSGFDAKEFALGPALIHRTLVRYRWAIGKEHLSAKGLVNKILAERLSAADQKARGTVYVYGLVHEFGIVKIGYSANVDDRRESWEMLCGYATHEANDELQGIDREAPHPRKLEALIHAELKEKRRLQLRCAHCGRAHTEWFEVNAKEAQKVVKKWTLWMQQNPYDESGYCRFGEDQIPAVGDCGDVPQGVPQNQRGHGNKAKRRGKSDGKSKLRRQNKDAAQKGPAKPPTHDYPLRSMRS